MKIKLFDPHVGKAEENAVKKILHSKTKTKNKRTNNNNNTVFYGKKIPYENKVYLMPGPYADEVVLRVVSEPYAPGGVERLCQGSAASTHRVLHLLKEDVREYAF